MGKRDERPIVVGVDASDSARAAADWAADLAAVWGAPLHLLHSVPGSQAPDVAALAWLRQLSRAAERSGAGPSRVEVKSGTPIDLLSERAAGAAMLVLGSYGEGATSGMLAGTVALALAGHVPCPVAVIRGPEPKVAPRRGGPVIVGVDGSAASHAALLSAADLAVSLGARLVAVHAWSDLAEDEHGLHQRREDEAELAAQGGALLAEETRAVTELYPGLAVADELAHDTPLRALLARADEARMIVVGHRGGPQAHGMGMGSTSQALVEFAPCPVVVTPPPLVAVPPGRESGAAEPGG
jgi:nucleotide-binding universal stress UspA family protein